MVNPLMDIEGARERLEAWKTRAEQRAAETQQASEGLQALRITATDDNGLIEMTIDHSGNLVDVRANSRITRQSADYTAEAILQSYQNAKRQLAEAAAEVVRETLGTDSATGKALMANFKTDVEDEER